MPFRIFGHYNTGCEMFTLFRQEGLWKPYVMLPWLVLWLALYYRI